MGMEMETEMGTEMGTGTGKSFLPFFVLFMSAILYGGNSNTSRTELIYAASFASLNDEMNYIFDYMKRRCCEGNFFLSSKYSLAGDAKVSHSLSPLP